MSQRSFLSRAVGIPGIIGIETQLSIEVKGLPFLKQKRWPRLAKVSGEARYGFSEDEEMAEHALDELERAVAGKDSKAFMHALEALIEMIMNKGDSEDAGVLQETV